MKKICDVTPEICAMGIWGRMCLNQQCGANGRQARIVYFNRGNEHTPEIGCSSLNKSEGKVTLRELWKALTNATQENQRKFIKWAIQQRRSANAKAKDSHLPAQKS